MTDAYLTPADLPALAHRVANSTAIATAARWFRGTVGVRIAASQVRFDIAGDARIRLARGSGLWGTTFSVRIELAAWEQFMKDGRRAFSRLLYSGALAADGNRLEFTRHVKLVCELLLAIRAQYGPGEPAATQAEPPEVTLPAHVTGTYVDVGGYRCYAEVVGDGFPVLLLHTAGLDGVQWRYVASDLAARGHRSYALDLPGHGRSDVPPGGHYTDIPSLAAAVRSFAAGAGLERYAVVGCSVGGDVSLELGIQDGDHVEAVVACAAADTTTSTSKLFLEISRDSAGSAGWNDMFELNCLACVGDAIPPQRLAALAAFHRRANHLAGTSDLIAWSDHDIRDRVGQIAAPALLVHGRHDFFVDSAAVQRTANAIQRGTYLELADVGHYPMMEDVKLGDRIAEFLVAESVR